MISIARKLVNILIEHDLTIAEAEKQLQEASRLIMETKLNGGMVKKSESRQVRIFEVTFDLYDIPEKAVLDFYSDLQDAYVQVYRDGEKVYRRHCGTGQGSFWTQFEEVNG